MRTRDSTSTHSASATSQRRMVRRRQSSSKRSQKRELKIGGKRISDVTRTDLIKTSIDLLAVLVDMFNVTFHVR